MQHTEEARSIIARYIDKTSAPLVEYSYFLQYMKNYAESNYQTKELALYLHQGTNEKLLQLLSEMERENLVLLETQDHHVRRFFYLPVYQNSLKHAMNEVLANPELPIPSPGSFTHNFPDQYLRVVDVKNEFVHYLQEGSQGNLMLKLTFPDGIKPILCTSKMFDHTLLDVAVQKIRQYLRGEKNVSYMRHKLLAVFRHKELQLQEMFTSILVKPNQVIREMQNPSEFSFHFWTQLSTNIIKEFSQKKDKLEEDHGYCQSGYIIGFYNVYFKSLLQKKKDQERSLKLVDIKIRKAPFVFSITDIYSFTDDKGVPLTKNCTNLDINGFIEEKIKAPSNKLPDVMKFSSKNRDYYIALSNIPAWMVEKIGALGIRLGEYYTKSWYNLLYNDLDVEIMKDDEAFEAHLQDQVAGHEAALPPMLNFNLVFLLLEDEEMQGTERSELSRIINKGKKELKSYAEIFRLKRETILHDASLYLPFWKTIPLLKDVITFFKRLFKSKGSQLKSAKGVEHNAVAMSRQMLQDDDKYRQYSAKSTKHKEKAQKPAAKSKPAAKTSMSYTSALEKLRNSYGVHADELPKTLKALIEEWNMLIDPVSKKNLIEDVNSLARNALRKLGIKRTGLPPDKETLSMITTKLLENPGLSTIRNQQSLREYIELYMLKLLQ